MSTKEYGTDKKSETNFSYLSIGSNIGDRLHYLSKSQIEIEKVIGKIHKSSKIYETEPWGYKEQNFFLNMVSVMLGKLMLIILMQPNLLNI